jgi:hypothetical protein
LLARFPVITDHLADGRAEPHHAGRAARSARRVTTRRGADTRRRPHRGAGQGAGRRDGAAARAR